MLGFISVIRLFWKISASCEEESFSKSNLQRQMLMKEMKLDHGGNKNKSTQKIKNCDVISKSLAVYKMQIRKVIRFVCILHNFYELSGCDR